MKKTILKNITVVAIAILTTFGAASCKKDTTKLSAFEYQYTSGSINFIGDSKNYTYNVSDIGNVGFFRLAENNGIFDKGDHCIALNIETDGSDNSKGVGFNYSKSTATSTNTAIAISAADINSNLMAFGFASPTTLNTNYYTLKSGSITFTTLSSNECKGTLTGTFTKGTGSTTVDGTATFDLTK